mgnify:CR=1 FL=1
MAAANLVVLSMVMVLIGYSAYALIFIRSASDPPIDENDPENADAIVYYLKREQYRAKPLFKGNTYDQTQTGIAEPGASAATHSTFSFLQSRTAAAWPIPCLLRSLAHLAHGCACHEIRQHSQIRSQPR